MTVSLDLEIVVTRVKEKRQNFLEYNFGTLRDDFLKTFFDLAQEYETMENFYRVSVSVIQEFFGVDSRLYLICQEGHLELVCDSLQGLYSVSWSSRLKPARYSARYRAPSRAPCS